MSKYKCVKQHDASDCGAAVIATICLQYGKETSITKLRDIAGTDIKGTTIFGIVSALEKIGFEAKAWKLDLKNTKMDFTLPVIARVISVNNFSHFVVIHKVMRKSVLIADPSKGLINMELTDFSDMFDGYVVLCIPSSDFISGKQESKSVFNKFFQLLYKQRRLFIIAIIGSFFLTVLGISTSFFSKILIDDILPSQLENQLLLYTIGFGVLSVISVILNSIRHSVKYFV